MQPSNNDDSVAQLVEQLTLNQWVEGSSPSGVTQTPPIIADWWRCFMATCRVWWGRRRRHTLYIKRECRNVGNDIQHSFVVPRAGLEPAHLAAHAPETCASTNSATWAFGCGCKGTTILFYMQIFLRFFYHHRPASHFFHHPRPVTTRYRHAKILQCFCPS